MSEPEMTNEAEEFTDELSDEALDREEVGAACHFNCFPSMAGR
jgi:hypothetical protein